jgi:hypothetical protein
VAVSSISSIADSHFFLAGPPSKGNAMLNFAGGFNDLIRHNFSNFFLQQGTYSRDPSSNTETLIVVVSSSAPVGIVYLRLSWNASSSLDE